VENSTITALSEDELLASIFRTVEEKAATLEPKLMAVIRAGRIAAKIA
jgi:hypothetical protein